MLYAAIVIAFALPAARDTQFLGKDPHGPLAQVRAGRLGEPGDDACRTWGTRGQTWLALDALGRVVGEATVTELERYDYTNCDELTLRGKQGAGIFVRGRYTPLRLEAWRPSRTARAALGDLIAKRDAKVRRGRLSNRRKDLPLDARLIVFRTPSGARYAVAGGRALSILRFDGKGWKEEHRELPIADEQSPSVERFMPVAVLDMDGDGSFDVVVHHKENEGEWYGDGTITRSKRGWMTISAGIFGSTA
jgi:hypothetical protein